MRSERRGEEALFDNAENRGGSAVFCVLQYMGVHGGIFMT